MLAKDKPCGCALRCYDLISKTQKQLLFDGIWKMNSFDTQTAYLCGCVKVINIKKWHTSAGEASRRRFSQVYYVN